MVPDIGFPSVNLDFCNCTLEGAPEGGGVASSTAGAAGLSLGSAIEAGADS